MLRLNDPDSLHSEAWERPNRRDACPDQTRVAPEQA